MVDEDILKILSDPYSQIQKFEKNLVETMKEQICFQERTHSNEINTTPSAQVKTGKNTTELAEQIQQLRERKKEIETTKSERKRDEERVAALRESVEKAKDKVLAYDEQLVRNYIEEIRVFPDKLTITVKGGAKEDIII